MTVSGLPTSDPSGIQELQGRHQLPTLSSTYAHNHHEEGAPTT